MAKPNKSSSNTKVTHIKADDADVLKKKRSVKASKVRTAPVNSSDGKRKPLRAVLEYFRGAWYELREVRWPDRRATWGMTGALLAFVIFFVILILLLDAGFKYLFQIILGA